ncbi:MAG: TolC family protein [Clostridiales bacterium]|jgi:outer membrane protein TolC|nr:TolC family protein [Clostridiales bacterium]
MRKISVVLTAALLLTAFSGYAAGAPLSLEDAKALAVSNSALLKAADLKIESDRINAREELDKKNRAKNTSPPPGLGMVSVVESTLQRRGYYSDTAAAALTLAELDRERTRNTIEFAVVNAYYGLQNAREMLKIKNESLGIARENEKSVRLRHDLGMASAREVQSAGFAAEATALEADTAKRAADYARLSLNNVLGIEDGAETVLADAPAALAPPEPIDVAARIKSALETRYEITALKLSLALAEKEAEGYGAFYTTGTYFYQLKAYNVARAAAALEHAEKAIALSVKKAYYDYLDSYNAALSADLGAQAAALAYGLAQSKFENGVGTGLDVITAQNALDGAKLRRVQAQTAYTLAWLAFESLLGVGLEPQAE